MRGLELGGREGDGVGEGEGKSMGGVFSVEVMIWVGWIGKWTAMGNRLGHQVVTFNALSFIWFPVDIFWECSYLRPFLGHAHS